jgi:hypothetical protein
MSAVKRGARKREATRLVNVALTVDERDAIDAAKGRLCRLISLTRDVLGLDSQVEDTEGAIEDLLDIMAEDVNMITAVFMAADGRQAGRSGVGGAR